MDIPDSSFIAQRCSAQDTRLEITFRKTVLDNISAVAIDIRNFEIIFYVARLPDITARQTAENKTDDTLRSDSDWF